MENERPKDVWLVHIFCATSHDYFFYFSDYSANQPASKRVSQPASNQASQPSSQQQASQSAGQPVSQSATKPASQPASLPASLPASKAASQPSQPAQPARQEERRRWKQRREAQHRADNRRGEQNRAAPPGPGPSVRVSRAETRLTVYRSSYIKDAVSASCIFPGRAPNQICLQKSDAVEISYS